ncbi:hypothetical protein NCCP2495_23160 [Dietzia sp. NCCP-2495]|uniref:hypothetical protein n=1 Tax=Dietzia sp. NCCP-2495 TaxID=2934675 RepID=UPI00222E43DC|nr:hypothetical protein [Dietzia sp. NCCP-2495]GLB64437.1 hypothetical protein NCCP2495_23160 [Dietzia sp. NCCP-2495]
MGTTPLTELQAEHVETFDLRRRCCPYLTYYRFGDTRKRGDDAVPRVGVLSQTRHSVLSEANGTWFIWVVAARPRHPPPAPPSPAARDRPPIEQSLRPTSPACACAEPTYRCCGGAGRRAVTGSDSGPRGSNLDERPPRVVEA